MHDEYAYSLAEIGGPSGPSIFPLSGYVILEPAGDPPTEAGLWLPEGFKQRYPQIGYCIATASSEIAIDDLCLINVESSDVARNYQRVFSLDLKDWGSEIFEPDVEPAIREAVESYRANPSTDDKKIKVETLNGEHLSFLASDVLSMQWTTTDSEGFNLLYPLHVKMARVEGGLFYFVHEDNILAVIE